MNFKFCDYVFNLVKQIPKGRISTYKEIAITLGNKNFARMVGICLSRNEKLIEIPCYRVICSNGEIGGYKLGVEKKKELLENDGFEIENNKIKNFKKYLFNQFKRNFH